MLVVPIFLAGVLFYFVAPVRIEAARDAGELLNRFWSSEPATRGEGLASLRERGSVLSQGALLRWIDWGTFAVIGAVCGAIIPRKASQRQTLNLLTTMIVGLCLAKLTASFGFREWPWFWAGTFVSVLVAAGVVGLRRLGGSQQTGRQGRAFD